MQPPVFSASNQLQAPSPPDEGDRAAHEAIGGARDFVSGLGGRDCPMRAVRRPPSAARTVSAMGLQVNQVGNARISAGAPSRWTRFLRTASGKDKRPSQTW